MFNKIVWAIIGFVLTLLLGAIVGITAITILANSH